MSPMTIPIRRATLDDIPVLVELMEDFYAESDYRLDRKWATTCFGALLSDGSLGAAWLGFHDGEPAGHVVLTVRFSMEYAGLVGVIDDLFVRPIGRRRGLG